MNHSINPSKGESNWSKSYRVYIHHGQVTQQLPVSGKGIKNKRRNSDIKATSNNNEKERWQTAKKDQWYCAPKLFRNRTHDAFGRVGVMLKVRDD